MDATSGYSRLHANNAWSLGKRCLALLALLFCVSREAFADILVVSPHPDDDVIMAAGVIQRALARGETVRVVYVTNGDYHSLERGTVRQGEAVQAQAALGLGEDNLIFLGYPDGYIFELRDRWRAPWEFENPDRPFVSPHGVSATYASRGLGRTDYHRYRHGVAGDYFWLTLVGDLTDVLTTYRPSHIFTTSQWDTHGDHEATYFLVDTGVRQAIAAVPGYNPTIHKTTVWPGDTSWPEAMDPTRYFTPIPKPPFTNRWGANPLTWEGRESLDVPLSMQSTFFPGNAKYLAVERHVTQAGVSGYIGRWIHKDEFFWTEQLSGTNRPPVPNAGLNQQVEEGQVVTLDGSASFDPDGTALTFLWRQVAGPTVTLSNPTAAQPTFTAPTGLSSDVTLAFELVVSDGALTTVPDAVAVVTRSLVRPAPYGPNLAPAAAIAASSQRTTTGQTAAKVADGSPLGYPTDATREWSTVNQGVGAWISMTWSEPVTIAKVVLYDRPNTGDQLVGGVITFSDGSTLPVGPLPNSGGPVEYPFSARTVTSLRLDVTQVSSTTGNVGLAEFEVFEIGGINRRPTANAGPDQIVSGGQLVTLDGTGSTDPNNDTLAYGWRQVSGTTVVLTDPSSPTPSFIAPPALPSPQTLTFELVVGDHELSSPPDSVSVLVLGTVNSAPTANAGPDQTVSAGATVTLDGSGTDPERQPLTYEWTQTGGSPVTLSNATAARPTFVTPASASDQVLTFELVVHDSELASAPDSVSIVVVAMPAAADNVAPSAAVATSSERAPRQAGSKAIDGYTDGYPNGNSEHEWATNSQRAGAWIELRWPEAHTVNRVRLHDRPNTDDHVLSGTLTFSDGSTVPVGALTNNGTGVDVVFPARSVQWVRFRVDSTGSLSTNIGLAEILVFRQSGTAPNQAPIANAGANQSVNGGSSVQLDGRNSSDPEGGPLTYAWQQIAGPAVTLSNPSASVTTFTAPAATRTTQVLRFRLTVNDGVSSSTADTDVSVIALPNTAPVANAGSDREVSAGTSVQLDGRGSSDADGDPLTYAWTQTGGTAVTLTGANTAQPTFTAPAAQTATQQLVFQLVVNDGAVNSAADSVTITIPGQAGTGNVAPMAVATASSERSSTQAASKAIDGIASGYPTTPSAEWASNRERVGAWIQLDWASNQTVNRVRLYDRPNLDDRITGATLLFSDGSSVAIGALPNNGTAFEVTFTARTIRWVRLRVDAVSAGTGSSGLAEFEVFAASTP